jgi:hypothetical protein
MFVSNEKLKNLSAMRYPFQSHWLLQEHVCHPVSVYCHVILMGIPGIPLMKSWLFVQVYLQGGNACENISIV